MSITEHISAQGPPTIAVIPAGERWPDGQLRPAIEDIWGAGAVIDAIVNDVRKTLSPESEVARQSWRAVRPVVADSMRDCTSGRELIDLGFPTDIEIASEVDQSTAVPILNQALYFQAESVPGVRRR